MNIGSGLLLWFVVSVLLVVALSGGWGIGWRRDRHQTQRAIAWWQTQQIERLHQETELIRDQLLQDLFYLRRSLDLGAVNAGKNLGASSDPETHAETHLEIADRCHRNLVQLSDRLFSPYALEDLTASLNDLVEQWCRRYPEHRFRCTTTGQIAVAEHVNHQFLLIWLDQCCRLLIAPDPAGQPPERSLALQVAPWPEHNGLRLTIQLQPPQPLSSAQRAQLRDLIRIFHLVQSGQCRWSQTPEQTQLSLQWPQAACDRRQDILNSSDT